ncbi:MAG: hypothetical protein ACI87W_002145 [Halieaceae bacterium]|jgi:hypothetical protein
MAAIDPAEKSYWFPVSNHSLTVHEEDNELILVDGSGRKIHQMSEGAALIFKLCDGRHSHSSMTHALQDTYAVDKLTAEGDVARVLAEFQYKNLVD